MSAILKIKYKKVKPQKRKYIRWIFLLYKRETTFLSMSTKENMEDKTHRYEYINT